jgi:hypothetical protein
MKAFRVTVPYYFPDMVSIYAAETPSKARYCAYLGMRDAGYYPEFGDIDVIRSPSYDYLAKNCEVAESLGWHDRESYYGCFDHRELHDKPNKHFATVAQSLR